MGKLPFPEVHAFEDVMRNFEAIEAAGMYAGSGAPAFVPSQNQVSYYFRKDTPTIANQRIYVYDGSTWTGIL